MKTIIAATALVASLAGASAAFALEPTNGATSRDQAAYGYVDNSTVGSISRGDAAEAQRFDGQNLNAVYGWDSDRGVSIGSRSSAE